MSAIHAVFFNNDPYCSHFRAVFSPAVREKLRALCELGDRIYSPADLGCDELRGAEWIFSTWGMPALSEEEIRKYLPNLKIVFYGAGSVQDFARPFLACGVRVFSAWAANAVPVVEYAVSEILLANKGFFQSLTRMKEHDRDARDFTGMPGNFNTKVGVIGCGMIGSMVCKALSGYRLEVLVSDPFASDEKIASVGAKRATLEEIFSECQTITNHTANNPQTVGMLNYSLFSRMKPNATFINTGRGAQVVEPDMIRALREEPGRSAVLDVTFPEPPEDDSPLWTMRNGYLTPHIAGSLGQEIERMGEYMAEEAARVSAGEPVRWEVSEKMLATMA